MCKVSPVRLLRIVQVLGQNPNGAYDSLANIKVFCSLNDPVNYKVKLPAEHLVQRLVLTWLKDTVPRQHQLSVGTLKHWWEQSQRKITVAPSSHTHLLTIKLKHCSDLNACLVKFKLYFLLIIQIVQAGRTFLWTRGVDGGMKTGLFIREHTCFIYSNITLYHAEKTS